MGKSILNKKSVKFLETYLNNPSPTGYEWEGQKIWMDYLKPYVDTFITDTYGTAVGVINPDAPYKVVIEGHSDEISWYVNYICLLYTSPSPRDRTRSRMPSSA